MYVVSCCIEEFFKVAGKILITHYFIVFMNHFKIMESFLLTLLLVLKCIFIFLDAHVKQLHKQNYKLDIQVSNLFYYPCFHKNQIYCFDDLNVSIAEIKL